MPSEGIVEDVATNGIEQDTTVNDMLAGGKLRTSVEDSIRSASSYQDKDGNTQSRSAKSVIGILADGKNQEEKEKARWRKRAKLAAILGLIGVIMAVGIQFAINYVANEMTKETTSVDFGDGAALVANGGEKIMQVAPATSKLTLAHALVLDMDHLQQLDEVVYRYEDADGKDVRVAAKVLEVQRAQGKNESDVTVTIITQTHNKLVLSPHQSSPMLWLNGTSHEICGDAKCANFMINDPGLDVDTLNARLDVIFAKSGGKDRRLAWVKCTKTLKHCGGATHTKGGRNAMTIMYGIKQISMRSRQTIEYRIIAWWAINYAQRGPEPMGGQPNAPTDGAGHAGAVEYLWPQPTTPTRNSIVLRHIVVRWSRQIVRQILTIGPKDCCRAPLSRMP